MIFDKHKAVRRALLALLPWSGAVFAQQVQQQAPLPDFDGQPTFTISNRTEAMHNAITGAGRLSSFHDPGAHALHESDVRYNTTLRSAWRSSFASTVRYTDSPQFDPNYWSVQYLNWTVTDARRAFSFGDLFANMSQYSMNLGLKGAGAQYNFSDDQNYIRGVLGTFDGQWAYLLRNDRADEPMDRYAGGARLQRAGEKWRLGFNMSGVRDRTGDPRRGTVDAYYQSVPSLDWEYRGESYVLNGQHAYSHTDTLPVAATSRVSTGNANKIALRGAWGIVNFDGNLEHVTPNFMTLAGSATADRWHGYGRGDVRLGRLWALYGIYDYYRDNLYGQLGRTTDNETTEAGFRRLRAFDRQTLSLSFSLRQRMAVSSDAAVNRRSDRWRVGMADRYFNVIDLRANVESALDMNLAGTPSKGKQHLFNIAVSSRHDWQRWQIAPSIEYGYQDSLNLGAGNYDVSQYVRVSVIGYRGERDQLGVDIDHNSTLLRTANGDAMMNRMRVFWQTVPAWMRGGNVRFEFSNNNYVFDDISRNYNEALARVVFQWNLDLSPRRLPPQGFPKTGS